jgi:hypothetical protein
VSDPAALASAGGLLSGYASAVYLIWRKLSRRGTRLYQISGIYQPSGGSSTGKKGLTADLVLMVVNSSDEVVSITDVLGLLRYDRRKFKVPKPQGDSTTDFPYVFSKRPSDFSESIPVTLGPNESKSLSLHFSFEDIDPDLLERYGTAHFAGFDRHGIGHIVIIENEAITDKNPIIMSVRVHVNGKRIIKENASLSKGGPSEVLRTKGTIAPMVEKEIEKEFWEKN